MCYTDNKHAFQAAYLSTLGLENKGESRPRPSYQCYTAVTLPLTYQQGSARTYTLNQPTNEPIVRKTCCC